MKGHFGIEMMVFVWKWGGMGTSNLSKVCSCKQIPDLGYIIYRSIRQVNRDRNENFS